MMTKEQVYSIWAPQDSIWSRWAKPVLFACMDTALGEMSIQPINVSWAPPVSPPTGLIIDLPAAEAVLYSIALAKVGYRPVPLYNAIPISYADRDIDEALNFSLAAVEIEPIIWALRSGALELSQLTLPPDAPPAFLLDSNRRAEGKKLTVDSFDNRSVSFTTDFPSANFLLSHGITRALLIQKSMPSPQPDLAHTLHRWHDTGLHLYLKLIDSPQSPVPLNVPKPRWYGAMFQRLFASFGLRRSGFNFGGFGGWMHSASSGG